MKVAIPGQHPSFPLKNPVCLKKSIFWQETMVNFQPRELANGFWIFGVSGDTKANPALFSRWCTIPLKPSAHKVQYGQDFPILKTRINSFWFPNRSENLMGLFSLVLKVKLLIYFRDCLVLRVFSSFFLWEMSFSIDSIFLVMVIRLKN